MNTPRVPVLNVEAHELERQIATNVQSLTEGMP